MSSFLLKVFVIGWLLYIFMRLIDTVMSCDYNNHNNSKCQASWPDITLSMMWLLEPSQQLAFQFPKSQQVFAVWHVSHSMADRQAGCLGHYCQLHDCNDVFGLIIPRGSRCT